MPKRPSIMPLYADSPLRSKSMGKYSPVGEFAQDERLLPRLNIQQPRSRRSWVESLLRIAVEIIIVLLLLINLYTSYHAAKGPKTTNPQVTSGPYNQYRRFGRDIKYMNFNQDHDYVWKETFQTSWAEVALPPHNTSSGLYSTDMWNNEGAISMFHAMHCLAGMRKAIQMLGTGETTLLEVQSGPHVPHCFDYLRNYIECHADPTFELARDDETGRVGAVFIEGQWDIHTCRDPSKLREVWDRYGKWRRYETIEYHDISE